MLTQVDEKGIEFPNNSIPTIRVHGTGKDERIIRLETERSPNGQANFKQKLCSAWSTEKKSRGEPKPIANQVFRTGHLVVGTLKELDRVGNG